MDNSDDVHFIITKHVNNFERKGLGEPCLPVIFKNNRELKRRFENSAKGSIQTGVEPLTKPGLFFFVPIDSLPDIEDGLIMKQ